MDTIIDADLLRSRKIAIYEPFSDFLSGSDDEKRFDITLLEVVRFAGHACPSIVGSFLISHRAIQELFSAGICVRGDVEISVPSSATQGAAGPISNVFGFIFGAWGETGFGGLQNRFVRRNLIHFSAPEVPAGRFRFKNVKTGVVIDVAYNPDSAPFEAHEHESFQHSWRRKIKSILENENLVLTVERVNRS